MKRVDIIFSSHLNSIVGPVQTLKRIISNHSFFLENGYDLTLYTLDHMEGTQSLNSKQASSVAKQNHMFFSRKIKEFARFLAQHSFIYGTIRIKLLFTQPKSFINNYLSLKRDPHIIVFHYLIDCYNYMINENKTKARIVLFIHGDSTRNTMLLGYFPKVKGTFVNKKIDGITNYVLSRVDRVISISKIGAKNFLYENPQLDGRIRVVVNGINDMSYEQKSFIENKRRKTYPQKYRLISCGSINGRKGQWIVIEALYRASKEIREEIEYTIVGDGPQRVTLEERVRRYGLKNVKFVGAVANVDVYKYLAKANIAILMSNSEGLPLSLIEALRCGLAGISTKVAAIPEVIVDGYNGLLIQPDVDQLCNVISHLHDYDWNEMGRKSRMLFEKEFTFDRMKMDYLIMLQEL